MVDEEEARFAVDFYRHVDSLVVDQERDFVLDAAGGFAALPPAPMGGAPGRRFRPLVGATGRGAALGSAVIAASDEKKSASARLVGARSMLKYGDRERLLRPRSNLID